MENAVSGPSQPPHEEGIAERYFTQPAIDRRMPETSRDARTTLALLKSEALLDGDPSKNLATFVTTFMEPEARTVIAENLHRNFIDHAEYPRTAEIAVRCVAIILFLYLTTPIATHAAARAAELLREPLTPSTVIDELRQEEE